MDLENPDLASCHSQWESSSSCAGIFAGETPLASSVK